MKYIVQTVRTFKTLFKEHNLSVPVNKTQNSTADDTHMRIFTILCIMKRSRLLNTQEKFYVHMCYLSKQGIQMNEAYTDTN
jgi:hypothetical protein